MLDRSPLRRRGDGKVAENQEQGEEGARHGMVEYTDAEATRRQGWDEDPPEWDEGRALNPVACGGFERPEPLTTAAEARRSAEHLHVGRVAL